MSLVEKISSQKTAVSEIFQKINLRRRQFVQESKRNGPFRSRYQERLRYYKTIYGPKILRSKPVICDRDSKCELHILVSNNDLLQVMWCLKTFYHYSGLRPKLVVHDDGTLTYEDISHFQKHFMQYDLIPRIEADLFLKRCLKGYKHCLEYRFDRFYLNSIKLLDFLVYSENKELMMMDSDVLFFKNPIELINCVNNGTSFFMSDYKNSYSLPVSDLNKVFQRKIIDRVNVGLAYLPEKKHWDLNLIDNWLGKLLLDDYHRNMWAEQTAFSVYFSGRKGSSVRLDNNYQISGQRITGRTVSHHFVNDGLRENFYIKGLKHLESIGFI